MPIRDLTDNLQKLIDAQKLLDEILYTYDPYLKTFKAETNYNPEWSNQPTLHQKILAYLKFDDSE